MYRPPTWLRIAIVVLVLAGAIAAAVAEATRDTHWIRDIIDGFGPLMPLAFIAVHTAASLVFVPRSVMALVAGTLWPFWVGSLWATVGAMVGALIGFWLARYVNAGLIVPEEMKKIGPALQRAETGGWRTIAVIRFTPILPHALTNYAFGVTRVPTWDYAVGSFVGMLPETVVFVNLGVTGRRALDGGAWLEPLLWGLGFLALSLLLPKLWRRWVR